MKMQQQQAALIKHGFIYKRTNKGTGLYCAEALEKAGGVSHGFSTRIRMRGDCRSSKSVAEPELDTVRIPGGSYSQL